VRGLTVCILACLLFVSRSHAQQINLSLNTVTLQEAFSALNEQYNVYFIYVSTAIEGLPKVSVQAHNETLAAVLDELLQGLPLTYSINGRVVTVLRAGEQPERAGPEIRTITGRVVDAVTAQGIPDVSIRYQPKPGGGTSSADGTFRLTVPDGVDSVRWTAVGYQPYRTAYRSGEPYEVVLEPLFGNLDEVVITGIVERNRNAYTSSTVTFSGRELKRLGGHSVLNALTSLDPSFVIIPNYLQGSNPNVLGQVELRGKTSISGDDLGDALSANPNLPLFVLDGFESSLQQVVDLDINRIASVTLLKDAASSALYGSQSANGVVVVETVKPRAGDWSFTYTSDFAVDRADLSDYNMMNAAEKLEFERLAGRYVYEEGNIFVDRLGLDRAYNDRLRKVLQGVNYPWMEMPLQPALAHNQSVYATAGNTAWQYGLGGNYRGREGVMKGSGRHTWSGYADIDYTKGEWKVLAKLNYFGNKGLGSPRMDFADYVSQSPYYTPEDGGMYFGEIPYGTNFGGTYQEINYVYDDQLNSYATERTDRFLNQLAVTWQPNKMWQIVGRFQLANMVARIDTFWSPKDTRYRLMDYQGRGEYSRRAAKGYSYQASLMGVWNRELWEKQFLTLNVMGQLMQTDRNNRGFSWIGFPDEAVGKPSEAFNFAGQRLEKMTSPQMIRRVNVLMSTNYNWDARFLMDATVRVDGSTQFGTANRYAAFWSVGVGWNLHHEAFIRNLGGGITVLRLRANTGLTGNQNFGSFASGVTYKPISPDGSIAHESLGNPFLNWQKTRQTNFGLDMEFRKGHIAFTANVFEKITSPLIAYIDLPPSTGVTDYALNVGDLRLRGVEGVFRISPVYQPGDGWVWTLGLTGTGYASRFQHLSKAMVDASEQLQGLNVLQRFQNGYSPDDLWAVRSLGIDPETGMEKFLTRDGAETFSYNVQDEVKVGNQRPWLEGVLSCYVAYKQFSIGGYFRYNLGASRLNEALYQKVENIGFDDLGRNQDRRALYDRWQQPGDNTGFKGISVLEQTPISSRFMQRENFISGEALSAGYVWDTADWLPRAGLQSIQLTGYARDFFRKSNILAERGTAYPFARSVELSLQVTF